MGGTITGKGNVTPVAEFNVHADPEAAHVVLNAFQVCTSATWLTSDVTYSSLFTLRAVLFRPVSHMDGWLGAGRGVLSVMGMVPQMAVH